MAMGGFYSGRARIPSLDAVNPKVSPALSRVVERAIELDPAARHQDVSSFREALVVAAATTRGSAKNHPYAHVMRIGLLSRKQ